MTVRLLRQIRTRDSRDKIKLDICTFSIEGGLKSIEFEVSVPSRDLLGVSGLSID